MHNLTGQNAICSRKAPAKIASSESSTERIKIDQQKKNTKQKSKQGSKLNQTHK